MEIKEQDKELPNVVEVVRYIRPHDAHLGTIWDYEFHSNLYGITIVYTLDYEKRSVFAKFSVCQGDNFYKYIGIVLAENSKKEFRFHLDNIEICGGLTNALIHLLCDEYGKDVPSNYQETANLFLRAMR